MLAFLDPKLRNPSFPSRCKLPTYYILFCECWRGVRSMKGGCYGTMAWHYDHFVNLIHRARTAPEHSAPAQQWWDRSTLTLSCQGLYDWLAQSNFRQTPFKYHLFNIWVLLWQPQENWWILSPLRVRNSLGSDTGSQKLLKCCAETLKK